MIKTTHNILASVILLCGLALAAQGQSTIPQNGSRVEGDPPDVQQPPQTLETGIHTMTRNELVSYIEKGVGGEVVRKYDTQFDDRMFAQTGAGTAIDGSFQPPREPKKQSFNKQPLGSRLKRFAMTCSVKFIVSVLDHRDD